MIDADGPAGAQGLPRERVLELVRRLLGDGLSVRLRVTGSSMSPFLRDGDVATLVPLGGRPIRRGWLVPWLRPWRRLVRWAATSR